MSGNKVDTSSRFKEHYAFLSGLSPAYHSEAVIQAYLDFIVPQDEAIPSFDNLALFQSDIFRPEILNQVNHLLSQYQGDALLVTQSNDKPRIEKELIWAAIQLYARMQAIQFEVGLVLEPQSEYADCLKKLETCKALLERNHSFSCATAVEKLVLHTTKIAEISNCCQNILTCCVDLQSCEAFFAWFIKKLDKLNETRLFWVWGRPNLDLALGALGQQEARNHLADTTYIPGQTSWSLYLFRGSLFFLKYMRKRCSDPRWLQEMENLSPEDRAMYRAQYIKAYWNIYKYRILNDYVWGPVNLFCFKWWNGTGFYSWMGDFSTCLLLCMDAYLTDLTFKEEQNIYEAMKKNYEDQLEDQLNSITDQIHTDQNIDMKSFVTSLNMQLLTKIYNGEVLTIKEKKLRPLIAKWIKIYSDYQNYQNSRKQKSQFLDYDRIYSKALLAVFAICVSLLIPGLLPVTLNAFLSTSGTILCFASTIVYRSVRAQLKITHCEETKKCLKTEEQNNLEEFLGLVNDSHPHENKLKRMQELHLAIVKNGSQINYQTATIQYERLELARTTFLRFFLPTMIGISMVYAPLALLGIPTYVFLVAASGSLAYVLDILVKQYKPNDVPDAFSLKTDSFEKFKAKPKIFSTYSDSLFANPRTNICADAAEPIQMQCA